ncbi:MAG: ATP-binding protein [Candidatus Omnitrophota bacterium]
MAFKYTILCVDDEQHNLDALHRTLRKEYEILTALSGEEGLRILETQPISLIISDQRMPAMTGVEFLEKSIELRPEIIRIILTGFTDVEDLIGAINTGRVYRYITKPWDPNDLKITVKRALESFELTQENRRLFEDIVRLEKLATVGQVAGGIAHEVRNQLSVLMGVQLIQQQFPENVLINQVAEQMMLARNRILSILDEIKAFGKQKDSKLHKERVAVSQLLEQTEAIVSLDPDVKKMALEIEVYNSPAVMCDRNRILQVLINLVRNAAHAMNGEGTIFLYGDAQNGEVRIRIKDNGCGIAAENLEKIWQPFFTTKGERGTGLGLQISRRIVEAHGGKLICESEAKKGSTFTVILPAAS